MLAMYTQSNCKHHVCKLAAISGYGRQPRNLQTDLVSRTVPSEVQKGATVALMSVDLNGHQLGILVTIPVTRAAKFPHLWVCCTLGTPPPPPPLSRQ